MKTIVDLYSGTGSSTAAFEDSEDWRVFRVDLLPKFEADLHRDIAGLNPGRIEDEELAEAIRETPVLEVEELPSDPEVVWASPPCTKFSVAALSKHWTEEKLPEKDEVVEHVKMAYRTLHLIREMEPKWWFVENPRGMLRKVYPFEPVDFVTYCQYGFDYMKPTDLYGRHPPSLEYKSCKPGSACHDAAPRGTNHQGLQAQKVTEGKKKSNFQQDTWNLGESVESRAKVPRGLSEAIIKAVENPGEKEPSDTSLKRWS